MRFLFASDSFKGSLSSEQIVGILTESAGSVFPDCECRGVSVADGGEGTVDAVIRAMDGQIRSLTVHGPLMEETKSSYGVFQGSHAVIEMAAASGLPMVSSEKRNPLHTTTYGTGELIRDALEQGYRKIAIAIGGSATNDGGMGAMTALGVKFFDKEGNLLTGFGSDLGKVSRIDAGGLHPAVAETEFTVMCDVTNPLTGPDGATYTFGTQKGGTPEILDRMEADMKEYAKKLCQLTGIDADRIPGSGAAGGLGAALKVFLHANLNSGIETVLDLIEFDSLLDGVDLVITGEGRMDWQSAFGKVPSGIGMRCRAKGIPALAIVGGMGEGAEKIYEFGIESIITTINGIMPIEEAMERAEELYRSAAVRAFRMLRAGKTLGR
ncbi:glycerate kinase [Lachnospiraceae bacterium 54-53]